jgi:hypothetical protein
MFKKRVCFKARSDFILRYELQELFSPMNFLKIDVRIIPELLQFI